MLPLAFPVERRRVVFDERVGDVSEEVCLGIKKYEVKFVEIRIDEDHIHFLEQSIPTYSVTRVVTKIIEHNCAGSIQKNSRGEEDFMGGEFWTNNYFKNTVSRDENGQVIEKYVRDRRKIYKQPHRGNNYVCFESQCSVTCDGDRLFF